MYLLFDKTLIHERDVVLIVDFGHALSVVEVEGCRRVCDVEDVDARAEEPFVGDVFLFLGLSKDLCTAKYKGQHSNENV